MLANRVPLIVLFLLAVGSARGQTVFFVRSGDTPGDAFGRAVGQAGDVNIDGFSDIIIGAPLDENNCTDNGIARVLSGKDGSIIYTFEGSQAFDYFGYSVAGGGDFNNDGVSDVIVGAPQLITGDAGFGGYARVFSGADGSILYSVSDLSAAEAFGFSVDNAEDTDSDGYDDFVVGAPGSSTNGVDSGSAFVFSGHTGNLLRKFNGQAAGDQLGWSVRAALDVDHDSFFDVIVGAPGDDTGGTDAGAARVFSGRDGSVLRLFTGTGVLENAGWSVAGIGDIDHDGFADLIVGAPNARPAGPASGSVRVYSGKTGTMLYHFDGTATGDLVGYAVSGASDVDGDGFFDFAFGAPGAPAGAKNGRAQVISGRDGSLLYGMEGKPTASQFGLSIVGSGELNKDAHGDFVVGAPSAPTNGPNSGDVVIFSGKMCLAAWNNYGPGWPGTNGVPQLTVNDNPVLCGTVTMEIENSRGIKLLAAMFLGLTDAQLPTAWDGVLLLIPSFIVPLTLPAGQVSVPVTMPCDTSFCGLTVYGQVLELDDGASKGVSFTPGMKLVLGGTPW